MRFRLDFSLNAPSGKNHLIRGTPVCLTKHHDLLPERTGEEPHRRQRMSNASLAPFRKMLTEELTTAEDYAAIDAILHDKYRPI